MFGIFNSALRTALSLVVLCVIGGLLLAAVFYLDDERNARIAGETLEQLAIDKANRFWGLPSAPSDTPSNQATPRQ